MHSPKVSGIREIAELHCGQLTISWRLELTDEAAQKQKSQMRNSLGIVEVVS